MSVKILAVGDVCGEPGLSFLNNRLRDYRREQGIDFVVVNGENANVVGITPKQADQILHAGADVVTLGNHTWTRTELRPYLEERRRIRVYEDGPADKRKPGQRNDVLVFCCRKDARLRFLWSEQGQVVFPGFSPAGLDIPDFLSDLIRVPVIPVVPDVNKVFRFKFFFIGGVG